MPHPVSRAIASMVLGTLVLGANAVSGVLTPACNDTMQWLQRTAIWCLSFGAALLGCGAVFRLWLEWPVGGFWAMLAGLVLIPAGGVWAYLAHREYLKHGDDDESAENP